MKKKSFSERMKRRLGSSSPGWNFKAASSPVMIPPAGGSVPTVKLRPSPLLGKDERGAVWPVVPAEAILGPEELNLIPYPIDHEGLRTVLLFFDRFDIPKFVSVDFPEWGPGEFERVGLLQRTEIFVDGSLAQTLQYASFATFARHDQLQPGQWSLSRPAQGLGIPPSEMSAQAGFAMTLNNALPVFTRDVELEDVVEFKRVRFDELVSLRDHLHDLMMHVGRNGTNQIAETTAFIEFEKSLVDYVRVMNESNRSKVWRALRTSMDWPTAAGAGAEFVATGNFSAGSLIGAGAGYGFRVVQGLRTKRSSSNPFEYLTSAHLDL